MQIVELGSIGLRGVLRHVGQIANIGAVVHFGQRFKGTPRDGTPLGGGVAHIVGVGAMRLVGHRGLVIAFPKRRRVARQKLGLFEHIVVVQFDRANKGAISSLEKAGEHLEIQRYRGATRQQGLEFFDLTQAPVVGLVMCLEPVVVFYGNHGAPWPDEHLVGAFVLDDFAAQIVIVYACIHVTESGRNLLRQCDRNTNSYQGGTLVSKMSDGTSPFTMSYPRITCTVCKDGLPCQACVDYAEWSKKAGGLLYSPPRRRNMPSYPIDPKGSIDGLGPLPELPKIQMLDCSRCVVPASFPVDPRSTTGSLQDLKLLEHRVDIPWRCIDGFEPLTSLDELPRGLKRLDCSRREE